MKGAPDLMIAVQHGLARKGKAGLAGGDDAPASSRGEGEPAGDEREHLVEIAGEMLKAFKDEDAEALADLLQEAFETCESYPHAEAGE